MKRLETLDILKYVACFFVIIIHMDIPQTVECIIQPVLTTAVPIFFMITGFFYSETLKAGNAKKQIRKIAVLALVANAVHIGWCCFKCLVGEESMLDFAAEIVDPTSIINLVVFNQPVWRTSIWYINALLMVLLLFYTVRKYEDFRKFYPFIPVLLVINLLLGTYSFALPLNEQTLLCYSRNVFFCGVPYFLLGNYVFINRQRVCKFFGKWQSVALFWMAGCLELWILDHFRVLHHKDHLLFSAFLALALFCVFLKKESVDRAFWKKIAAFGRKHSFVIYVVHSIIIELFYKIVDIADRYLPLAADVFTWIGPLLVLVAVTLFAHVFGCFKERVRLLKAS